MSALTETLRDSGRALAGVFRNPGLRRVQLAFAASVMGDWAYAVAIGIYAYQQGGAATLGLLTVARYGISAIATPFTATLADRLPRTRVMVGADVVRFVLVSLAAATIWGDGPALAVYALAVVAHLCGTPFRPAQAAILPALARTPDELTAANVTASTVESVGFFMGPAIAGILLGIADVPTVVVFDALTFLLSALLVAGVREPPTAAAPDAGGADGDAPRTFRAEAAEGFRTIGADADLRALVGLLAVQCLAAGAMAVLIVAIGLDLLDIGPSGVGFLDGVTGIGGLVGGLVALPLARGSRLARNFAAGVLLWGAPLLLIAAVPEVAVAAVAVAFVGFGNALVDVNIFTIVQRIVPDAVLGRVFGAVEAVFVGSVGVGALLTPLGVEVLGIRGTLAVVGAAVCGAVVLSARRMADADGRLAPPPHLSLLRGVPFLAPLPEAVLERLAFSATPVRVPAGTDVFARGEVGDRFYVVIDGEAEILGRPFGPGSWFGEIALLRDVPRTATVSATTDLHLLAVGRDDFVPAVTGHGDAVAEADALVTARLLRG